MHAVARARAQIVRLCSVCARRMARLESTESQCTLDVESSGSSECSARLLIVIRLCHLNHVSRSGPRRVSISLVLPCLSALPGAPRRPPRLGLGSSSGRLAPRPRRRPGERARERARVSLCVCRSD